MLFRRACLLLFALTAMACSETNSGSLKILCKINSGNLCLKIGLNKKYVQKKPNDASLFFNGSCQEYENIDACNELALTYIDQNNTTEGLRILTNLCNKNSYRSCYNIGVLDVAKDNLKEAEQLFQKGCENGHQESCVGLGSLLIKSNVEKAIQYFTQACDSNIKEGCFELSEYFLENKNFAKSLALSKNLCADGYLLGCLLIAKLQLHFGKIEEAKGRLYALCEQDQNHACLMLEAVAKKGFRYVEQQIAQ